MTYTLNVQAIAQSEVGTKYHLGLGIPDPGGSGDPIIYGYCLVNDPQRGLFNQSVDITARDQLLTASPEIIDRDLVSFPRVSQGDFSGGQGQLTFADATRYFDSDLDIDTPGFLRLRPGWKRFSMSPANVPSGQVVGIGGAFYSLGIHSGVTTLYRLYAGAVSTVGTTSASLKLLASDQSYVFASDGTDVWRYNSDGTNEVKVTNGMNGTPISAMWPVKQGTNGYRLYYAGLGGPQNLWYVDLTAAYPVAAAAQAMVPIGGMPVVFNAVVPFSTGVAILALDESVLPNSCDIWYFDGTSTTRLHRIGQRSAGGMVAAAGALWVTTYDAQGFSQPRLLRVDTSSVQVAATPGLPTGGVQQLAGAPVSTNESILFPVTCTMQGVSGKNYLCQYNFTSGALSHLQTLDASDANSGFQVDVLGSTPGGAMVVVGANFQILQNSVTGGASLVYAPSGILVTSRVDFNTPGITKRIRRLSLTHAPLAAGESITVEGHVDQDPSAFAGMGSPSPVLATVTNAVVGSTQTVLTFPGSTIGKTAYAAVKLVAGTAQATSPNVFDLVWEISTPWAFKETLDCTSERMNLDAQSDRAEQGLRGKDLYWLIALAWEDALPVTFYAPNGVSYSCEVEDVSVDMRTPQLGRPDNVRDPQDFDSYVTLTLRQVA